MKVKSRIAAIIIASLAFCHRSEAIIIAPNETVRVDCCEGAPAVTYSGTGPITDMTFNFTWSDSQPWLQNTWVYRSDP